jgi:hypothetical protein
MIPSSFNIEAGSSTGLPDANKAGGPQQESSRANLLGNKLAAAPTLRRIQWHYEAGVCRKTKHSVWSIRDVSQFERMIQPGEESTG